MVGVKNSTLRQIKLTRQEREIEEALIKGEYVDVKPSLFEELAEAISSRKKDAVLNIRINKHDLENIKKKAKHLGVRYQTFVSELLHHVAHN